MCCNCKYPTSGRGLLYGSTARTKISWTASMSGYISNGRPDQTIRCITCKHNEGTKPDVVSVATILPVRGELPALNQGKGLHGYALKHWFLPNVSLSTFLKVMYSKCGKLDCLYNVFENTEKKNVICWSAMIDTCLKVGCLLAASRIFQQMHLFKHMTDSISMPRISVAFTDLCAIKIGKELHCQIFKRDIIQVPFVSAVLIKFYGMCSDVQKAQMVARKVVLKIKQGFGRSSSNEQFLQVIDASMKQKCQLPDSNAMERILIPHNLQLLQLHQLCEKYFHWTLDGYIVKLIAERDMRRFVNLGKSYAVLGAEILLNQMPVAYPLSAIVKPRKQFGTECFEVSWEDIHDLKTSIVVKKNFIFALFDTWGARVAGLILLKSSNTVLDLSSRMWTYKVGIKDEEMSLFAGLIEWKTGVSDLPTNQPLVWYKTSFNAPDGYDPISLDLTRLGHHKVTLALTIMKELTIQAKYGHACWKNFCRDGRKRLKVGIG